MALVTGAASGIGAASALALAGAGARLALVDKDAVGLERTRSQAGAAEVRAYVADLVELAALRDLVGRIVADFERIDILANVAGIGTPATLLNISLDAWEQVQTVNLKAPLILIQAVAEHMIECGIRGRIVNVASGSAFRATSNGPYAVSKAGLVQLTMNAAAELGSYGINVNAIAPGLTRTPMTAHWSEGEQQRLVSEGPLANLLGRVSEPEDVAAVLLFLCLPASRQITAQTVHTSAGAIV